MGKLITIGLTLAGLFILSPSVDAKEFRITAKDIYRKDTEQEYSMDYTAIVRVVGGNILVQEQRDNCRGDNCLRGSFGDLSKQEGYVYPVNSTVTETLVCQMVAGTNYEDCNETTHVPGGKQSSGDDTWDRSFTTETEYRLSSKMTENSILLKDYSETSSPNTSGVRYREGRTKIDFNGRQCSASMKIKIKGTGYAYAGLNHDWEEVGSFENIRCEIVSH